MQESADYDLMNLSDRQSKFWKGKQMPEKIILGIACFMILAAVLTVFFYRRHTKQVMQNLDAMLDAAINGTFTEENIDETMFPVRAAILR